MSVHYGYKRRVPEIIDYLLVAGGGGGGIGRSGNHNAGGGGGGGVLYGILPVTKGNQFSITIGGGGASATNGSNSTLVTPIQTLTAVGGGKGGGDSVSPTTGFAGGSGGGGAGSGGGTARAGGSGTVGQGTTGGTGYGTSYGGGGGGANGGSEILGVNATTSISGNGGPGIPYPINNNNAYSVYFDGTGDYLTVGSGTNNFSFGTGNFTIEFWFNTLSIGADKTIYSSQQSASYTVAPDIYLSSTGILKLQVSSNGSVLSGSTTLLANTWYHVALVRNLGTTKFYLNGVAESNTFTDTNDYVSVANRPLIGVYGRDTNFYNFNGYISNLRVVKGAAVYTTNFTPSTSPLTAISGTSLLTCSSSSIKDLSSNNFSITRVGDTYASLYNPFAYASTYFDGTGDYLTLPTGNAALAFGNSDFTVEAWVYRVSGTGQATIFVGQSDLTTAAGSSYVFYIAPSHTADLYIGSTAYAITSPNPPLGSWNHVAWVRKGGTFTSYLNGVQVGNRTDLGTGSVNVGSTSAPPSIGAFSSGINTFNGYINNLRVIKGTAVYTTNFTPSTSPLTAVSGTSLLTCQNARLSDNSTNNFSITINGNTTTKLATPFIPYDLDSYSTYLDGTGDYITIPGNSVLAFGTGDFTIEAWIFATYTFGTTGQGRGAILGNRSVASSSTDFVLQHYNGKIYFGTSAADLIVGNTTMTANIWYHVAVTRSSGTIRLFINGISDATAVTGNTTNFSDTTTLAIGCTGSYSVPTYPFTGFISNLRIVKGTAVYTSNFTVPEVKLTAISGTSLLTCHNNLFTDTSSNNLVLTPVGDTKHSIHNPFIEKYYYAPGGGGAGTLTTGGFGGGGVGGTSIAPTSGLANKGAGGGGGTATGSTPGGSGGSGVAILRLPISSTVPAAVTGSPSVTVTSGYRIYKWTSSGSITF